MLSVVIIEYHSMPLVHECLRSVQEHLRDLELECVVLSNSCYDSATLATHRELLTPARIVAPDRNLGYAGGVNAALAAVSGEYIYLLNPDVLLTDSGAAQIVQDMERDPDWALAGPKVINERGEVQPSCRSFPKLWTFLAVRSYLSSFRAATFEAARYLMSHFARNSTICVDWISGGAIIAKTSAIRKFGGMDDRYFLYMEDVDWCRAAWESGLKVMYCPTSTVVHAGRHQSIRTIRSRHFWWHMRSLAKYFLKYRLKTFPTSEEYRRRAL